MAKPKGPAARVTELEARYTLQQDLLQQLSDVLWRQRQELDLLEQRVAALERRVADVGAATDTPSRDEDLPPHY
jgi:SlyX protein